MMGLVISDSFKAVVTIYILIPFLVIPQIILSGVMVKFEKLNPNLSSPISIPFYGEGIVARWGYEALAVEQFMNNKYEKQFYSYEKFASQAQYYKDYWSTGLIGKLDNIDNNIDKSEKSDDYFTDLKLVKYEITKRLKAKPDSLYNGTDMLSSEKVTHEAVGEAKAYAERVKKYYIRVYKWASDNKEALMNKYKSMDSEGFQKLSDDYTNKKLEEFVKDKNETDKITEYKGSYVQKMDPIFKDPEHKFIKAHFYAPRKQVFGLYVNTYLVNVVVLWIMTFLLYLALYFRLLKKFLDSGEVLMGKKKGD